MRQWSYKGNLLKKRKSSKSCYIDTSEITLLIFSLCTLFHQYFPVFHFKTSSELLSNNSLFGGQLYRISNHEREARLLLINTCTRAGVDFTKGFKTWYKFSTECFMLIVLYIAHELITGKF